MPIGPHHISVKSVRTQWKICQDKLPAHVHVSVANERGELSDMFHWTVTVDAPALQFVSGTLSRVLYGVQVQIFIKFTSGFPSRQPEITFSEEWRKRMRRCVQQYQNSPTEDWQDVGPMITSGISQVPLPSLEMDLETVRTLLEETEQRDFESLTELFSDQLKEVNSAKPKEPDQAALNKTAKKNEKKEFDKLMQEVEDEGGDRGHVVPRAAGGHAPRGEGGVWRPPSPLGMRHQTAVATTPPTSTCLRDLLGRKHQNPSGHVSWQLQAGLHQWIWGLGFNSAEEVDNQTCHCQLREMLSDFGFNKTKCDDGSSTTAGGGLGKKKTEKEQAEEFHWYFRCASPSVSTVWSPETDKYWPLVFRKIIRYCLKIRIPGASGGHGRGGKLGGSTVATTVPHDVVTVIGAFL